MPNEHSILPASSSKRWMNCTASTKLEENLPDKTSEFAAEGTLAHSVAELKARKKFTLMKPSAYNAELKKLKADPLWQAEMDTHTDTYVNFLVEQAQEFPSHPCVALEVRVDYSAYAPTGFGTADCIMVGGDTIRVNDFKYGKGIPVSSESNSQMMLYALGALNKYAPIYGDSIKRIFVSIIQPRLDSISTWETTREALEQWGRDEVMPAAEAALNGTGEFAEGEWCRFCRAKATCKARSNANTALEDFAFALSPTLSNAEIGEILLRAQRLKSWVSDLEEYALSAVLAGEDVPGWKAVEGRSNRQFTDTDAALTALINAGTPKEMLYKYEPITLTAIEKLLGAKAFDATAGAFIIKPPGKPTLVTEKDKRPAYSSAASDFAGVMECGL
jgi:hypothetical protein